MLILKYIIKKILYSLIGLFPRNSKIWIFRGFADKYVDNSKYLFEYVNQNTELLAIWITNNIDTYLILKNKNKKCYMKYSFLGLYYAIRGKFHFYGDYNDYLTSAGAITVNLWHGTPIKKIEFDIKQGPLKYIFNNTLKSKISFLHIYRKPDYIISSSSFISNVVLSSAFRVDADKCLNFGYPRNDIFKKIEPLTSLNKDYSKVFIYLPTWRDDGKDFINSSGIVLKKLNDLMIEKNSLFIFKLHPATNLNIDVSTFSNIKLLDKNVDLYEILPRTDVLITDYSSVFFDYMLLDKDIVFFPFDYKEYYANREFYFDYKEIVPTKPVFDFESLCIRLFQDFIISDKYREIKNKAWDYTDLKSSQRIANYFLNHEESKNG